MTGPEHYAEAERLLTDAFDEVRHGDPAEAVVLAQAQVHATLALAAATAVGTAGPDGHAWAEVAATKPSTAKPEAPGASRPGSGPVPRRPPPLFPEPDPPR